MPKNAAKHREREQNNNPNSATPINALKKE
jgi:hypothetical protein